MLLNNEYGGAYSERTMVYSKYETEDWMIFSILEGSGGYAERVMVG